MKTLLAKLLIPFAMLEQGTFTIKMEVSIGVAILLSPLVLIISNLSEYLLGFAPILVKDSDFLRIIILFLFFDLVLGAWKHWEQKTFDWKRLYTGFLEKVFVSLIGMVLFNAVSSIKEFQEIHDLERWFILTGKLMNLFYIGGSAFSSMYVITGGKFPPIGFMKRLKSFNETLNINELTKNDTEEKPE